MKKKKKALKPNELEKVMDLFIRHGWSINTSRYENFCSLGGQMDADEFSLLFELVDRFHLLDVSNFMDRFLMGYYSSKDEIFQNARSVIVTPMKIVDSNGHHKADNKSGDIVSSMFEAKRNLCEYEDKLVFCKDAFKAKIHFQDGDVICFVDDFIGTGKTYQDTYQSFVSYFQRQNVVIGKENVFAIATWAMRVGYDFCNEQGLRLYCAEIFEKAISEDSNFSDVEISARKKLMVQMEKSYGFRISKPYSLGFKQSEALVSIMGKSPNNTFPIFWKAKQELNIFPRFKNNENRNKTSIVGNG